MRKIAIRLTRPITVHRLLPPGRIEYVNTAVPETGPTEILIRMEGVEYADPIFLYGKGDHGFPILWNRSTRTRGWGRVVAKGNKVERFKVGDRVAALSFYAFALFEKVDQSSAVLIPEELDKHPFPGEALVVP
jgi:NADPH:quinone reductase-like Zn-dependent oxidoreductase